MSRSIRRFADMLGDYTITAYCENFRCPRSQMRGVELDIAELMQQGYRGEIGRTVYRCTWCRKPGTIRMSPIHTGGFRDPSNR